MKPSILEIMSKARSISSSEVVKDDHIKEAVICICGEMDVSIYQQVKSLMNDNLETPSNTYLVCG